MRRDKSKVEVVVSAGELPVLIRSQKGEFLAEFLARLPRYVGKISPVAVCEYKSGNSNRMDLDGENAKVSCEYIPPRSRDEELSLEITILQLAARAALFKAGRHELILLHGSCAVSKNGNAVLCLDDGHSRGKTTLSLGVALSEGAICIDEFAFMDARRLEVVGQEWPLHVRRDAIGFLNLPGCNTVDSDLHEFPANLNLSMVRRVRPDIIVFPRAGRSEYAVHQLTSASLRTRLTFAAEDHLRKLLNPSYDRVSIFQGQSQPVGLPSHLRHTSDATILESLVNGLTNHAVGVEMDFTGSAGLQKAVEFLNSFTRRGPR